MSQTTPDLSTVASARKALVAALRSGEYKQGRGKLKSSVGYCCLGVAGDLCVKAGVARWDESALVDVAPGAMPAWNYLFDTFEEGASPFGFTHSEESRLADANDQGVPFSAIADLIESAGDGPVSVTWEWLEQHAPRANVAV